MPNLDMIYMEPEFETILIIVWKIFIVEYHNVEISLSFWRFYFIFFKKKSGIISKNIKKKNFFLGISLLLFD